MTMSLLVLGLPESCENLCPSGLLCVISGLLAGGSPGFRTVLCCFLSQLSVWRCSFCFVFCCFGSRHTNLCDDAQAIICSSLLIPAAWLRILLRMISSAFGHSSQLRNGISPSLRSKRLHCVSEASGLSFFCCRDVFLTV